MSFKPTFQTLSEVDLYINNNIRITLTSVLQKIKYEGRDILKENIGIGKYYKDAEGQWTQGKRILLPVNAWNNLTGSIHILNNQLLNGKGLQVYYFVNIVHSTLPYQSFNFTITLLTLLIIFTTNFAVLNRLVIPYRQRVSRRAPAR